MHGMCAKNNTWIWIARTSNDRVISVVASYHGLKLCAIDAPALGSQQQTLDGRIQTAKTADISWWPNGRLSASWVNKNLIKRNFDLVPGHCLMMLVHRNDVVVEFFADCSVSMLVGCTQHRSIYIALIMIMKGKHFIFYDGLMFNQAKKNNFKPWESLTMDLCRSSICQIYA